MFTRMVTKETTGMARSQNVPLLNSSFILMADKDNFRKGQIILLHAISKISHKKLPKHNFLKMVQFSENICKGAWECILRTEDLRVCHIKRINQIKWKETKIFF